jgi:putative transposase
MQYIKGGFSFRLKSRIDVWQSSYDSRRITDSSDYATHIHQNPVRAKLTSESSLYPFSSAHSSHPSGPPPIHLA